MTHLDAELQALKADLLKMWNLVIDQITNGKESLLQLDQDLAQEIVMNESRVNAYELKIDRDCENLFALFNPVAVDLRCVLAVLKINTNLERIGDNAEGIAKFVIDVNERAFDKKLLEITRVVEMYERGCEMLKDVYNAFDKEDSSLAKSIFDKDQLLDDINHDSTKIIAQYIRENPDHIEQALLVLSTIRKLERLGDQIKNIAEEIIFFIEAVVLKHQRKMNRKTTG
jgi:phosphate transport system protein